MKLFVSTLCVLALVGGSALAGGSTDKKTAGKGSDTKTSKPVVWEDPAVDFTKPVVRENTSVEIARPVIWDETDID